MRETKKAFNYKYTMYKCDNCDEHITPAQGMDNGLCNSCTEEVEEVQQAPIYFTGEEFANIEKDASKEILESIKGFIIVLGLFILLIPFLPFIGIYLLIKKLWKK